MLKKLIMFLVLLSAILGGYLIKPHARPFLFTKSLFQYPSGDVLCGKEIGDWKYYGVSRDDGDEDTNEVNVFRIDDFGKIFMFSNFRFEIREQYAVEPGYFQSWDGGETWQFLAKWERGGTLEPTVKELIFPRSSSPADKRVAYKVVREQIGASSLEVRHSLERSDDGANTWQRVNAMVSEYQRPLGIIYTLTHHPQHPRTIYCEGRVELKFSEKESTQALYISTDGGDTFRVFHKELGTHAGLLSINPTNPNVMYATGRHGLLRKTTDGGRTWHPVGQQEEIRRPYVTEKDKAEGRAAEILKQGWNDYKEIVVDPELVDVVYIVSYKGILKSQDGGEHWRILDLGIDNANTIYRLAIDPRNKILYASTHYGLFKSTDQGCTWEKIEIHKRLVRE